MKTDIHDPRRRGAISTLIAASLPAAISLLCFTTGCATAPDDAPVASTSQALGASCKLLRPFGWSSASNQCHESLSHRGSITLADGECFLFVSAPGPGLGVGERLECCHDGVPEPDPWDDFCIPDRGGGGGNQ
jgi:hypothetical protein